YDIGGPGCGKGTQCKNIVEKYGFAHLSIGDLLRAEVKSGSKRGEQLTQLMEKGELVSDDIVLELLRDAIFSIKNENGYIIDGYPRQLSQGIQFDSDVTECRAMLYFECSDDTMISRLLERAKTSGRVDDNEETIKLRLKTFHELTQPAVEHYRDSGKLMTVSAVG
ncbi:uncharacterized protein TRIADDRAFT_21322, partial [Trichoplax adhaerens]